MQARLSQSRITEDLEFEGEEEEEEEEAEEVDERD